MPKNLFSLIITLLFFFFFLPPAAAVAAEPVYGTGHTYTPADQPVRYWKVGVTSKPPPKGVHPEYAQGRPDNQLAGWARKAGDLVIGFGCDKGLKNVEGADLFIWHFGTGGTRVHVSTQADNPTEWHLLGDLPVTKEHAVEKYVMDFGALDKVHFVKIEKWDAGFWGKGRFIDAIGGMCR